MFMGLSETVLCFADCMMFSIWLCARRFFAALLLLLSNAAWGYAAADAGALVWGGAACGCFEEVALVEGAELNSFTRLSSC